MWRCLNFVVAVALWNVTVLAVPQGENTCQGVVKHPVKVKVNVTEPVTFRTYTWCLRVPPRCSKYVVQMRERVKEQVELHNRTITVCCRGFVEMESKCVPACPPMTECPNMRCNRTNHCYCSPGYSGVFCNDPCPKGSWGRDCKKPCDCPDGFTCHHLTGDCMLDDKPSVKTTVRRAFTHGSLESVPTTFSPPATSSEQMSPSTLLKSTSTTDPVTTPTTTVTTTTKLFVPTIETSNPPVVSEPSSTMLPLSTSTSSTTTATTATTTTTTDKTTMTTEAIDRISEFNINNLSENSATSVAGSKLPVTTSTLPQEIIPSSDESFITLKPLQIPEVITVPLYKINHNVFPIFSTDRSRLNLEKKVILNPTTTSQNSPVDYTEQTSGPLMPPSTLTNELSIRSNLEVTPSSESFSTSSSSRPEIIPEPPLKESTSPSESSSTSSPKAFIGQIIANGPRTVTTTTKLTAVEPVIVPTWKDQLSDELTSGPPPSLYDLPVTKSVDVPMTHMQTPNRNWNPFIPSPGATQSHGSLTIPLSINVPVIEISSTSKAVDPISTTLTSASDTTTKTIETSYATYTVLQPTVKSTVKHANTFLHSFSEEPTDSFVTTPEQVLLKTTPSPEDFFYPMIFKIAPIPSTDLPPVNVVPKNPWENLYTRVTASTPLVPQSSTMKNSKEETKWAHNKDLSFRDKMKQLIEFSKLLTYPIPVSSVATPVDFPSPSKVPQLNIEPTQAVTHSINTEISTPKTLYEGSFTVPVLKNNNYFTIPSSGILENPHNMFDEKKYSSSAAVTPEGVEPKIITADSLEKVDGAVVESVNIVSKNELISVRGPSPAATSTSVHDVPYVRQTQTKLNGLSTTDSIITKINLQINKSAPYPDNVDTGKSVNIQGIQRDDMEFASEPIDFTSSRRLYDPPQTTPLTPSIDEIHPVVNGKSLEEPSNYLPTIYEKPTTSPKGIEIEKSQFVKSTKALFVTESPQSIYLPTNRDVLNLSYILNTINDFTPNSKKGMKQSSKSSIYGNPIKIKLTEKPVSNDLVTNAVYDNDPSAEMMKTISIHQIRKNRKPDHLMPRLHKDKTAINDSKIIHLNISSHFPFHNPATKAVQKSPEYNADSAAASSPTYMHPTPGSEPSSSAVDGRVTTVSIISTVPILKYPTKRSTKEFIVKTENAYAPDARSVEVADINDLSKENIQDTPAYNPSTVAISDLNGVPFIPIRHSLDGEEVPKKPFRRKESISDEKLEDFRPNMTAALAAESTEETNINLTTGIVATVVCVLLLGSVATGSLLFFIYCKKEKPVPMESCIMAYGQPDDPDPSAIYSVPRPSLMPEIFFCPTFSHHYAAQINKELRELSYEGPTKKEISEPVYTEIDD